jgi:Zn-dependent protease with chaperone function
MIGLLLTLPTYGATLKDLDSIVNLVRPVCNEHKLICTFRVIEFPRPLAYTRYNNITLSNKTVEILTEDELRSVVFHEVAHAVLRHSNLGQQYITSIYSKKGRQPTEQEIKSYRYKVELEADRYSTILLYQYGYTTKLPEALAKLSTKKYSEESISHPSDRDRINNIRNLQRILK